MSFLYLTPVVNYCVSDLQFCVHIKMKEKIVIFPQKKKNTKMGRQAIANKGLFDHPIQIHIFTF